jgi:hypothetical protein
MAPATLAMLLPDGMLHPEARALGTAILIHEEQE